jgi:hypothetical protein
MLFQSILRQFFGTFVAVLCGWGAGILVALLRAAVGVVVHPGQVPVAALIAAPWIVALGSVSFILPVWLLLLVPLYFFVPRSWPLWRWPICTALGALAGISIIAIFLSRPDVNPPESISSWYVLAAIIGGVTCFVGSVTRERFGFYHARI